MKLTDLINEEKYTIIDPKGNPAGTGTKMQANQRQKKLGGSKKGYFVVPAKKALKARRTLEKYKFDFKSTKLQDLMSDLYFESVNEGIEPQIKKIAYFTGTRPEAVEDFVSKHALNFTKLLKYVEKGGLPQRMELVSALAGRPDNPKQKKIIKQFQESINEGYSTEEKRIVMMAVRKLAKYRNVPLDYAINDLLGAGQELERDIKKGKIK